MKKLLILLVLLALPTAFAFQSDTIAVKNDFEVTKDTAKEIVPETYELTDENIVSRHRFLMYTYNGKNILWGHYGNGHLVGQDNHGKRMWGIYGNRVFAGFYDGEFFWGKYGMGRWRAFDLFGLNRSAGRYILFP